MDMHRGITADLERAPQDRLSRRRRGVAARILATVSLAASSVLVFGAARPAAATSAAFFPQTSFNLDGDPAGPNDWNAPYGVGTTPGGFPTTGVYYNHTDNDPCGVGTDDIAGPGLKIDDGPNWATVTGSVDAKSDLSSVSMAAEKVNVAGQINDILYAGYARCGGNGSLSAVLFIDNGDGILPSAGGLGDFLFIIDFNPGGGGSTTTRMFIRTSTTSWGTAVPYPANAIEGAVNGDGTFGEVALNLTSLKIPAETTCQNLAITGTSGTDAGGSTSSAVKDLVAITPLIISNCGALNITKAGGIADGTSLFHYVIAQSDGKDVQDSVGKPVDALGVTGLTGTTDEVPTYDGDPTEIDATIKVGGTDHWTNVISQPDYILTEDSLPPGWTLDTIVCTYTDIFSAGTPLKTVTIYSGGAPTGNTYLVPPASLDGTPLPPASCTITNKATGLNLNKIVVTDNGGTATQANFTLTAKNALNATVINGVDPNTDPAIGIGAVVTAGTYTLSETSAVAGYAAGLWTCTDETGSAVTATATGAGTATVPVTAGHVVTCAITNNDIAPTLTVKKSVSNTHGGTLVPANFPLFVNGSAVTNGLANPESAGVAYTVTETQQTGYTQTSIVCNDNLTAAVVAQPVVLALAQNVTCTINNTDVAPVLSVTKAVTGVASTLPWSFSFSLSPLTGVVGASPQTLSGTGNTTSATTASWTNLTAGTTYTLTETAVTGWTPTITCTGANVISSASGIVTFTATVGATVTCSATNAAAPASVSVSKSVTGVAATLPWSFDFSLAPTTGVTGLSPQTLSGTGNTTSATTASWTALTPGTTYTITETAVAGWTAVITCTGVTDLDAVANTFTFVAGVAQSLVCSATNAAAPAQVSVTKSVSGVAATLPWSFDFSLSPTTGVTGVSPQTLSGTGNTTAATTASWTALTPGTTYTITEAAVSSWTQTISCVGVTDLDAVAITFTFVAGVGQSLVCSATNAAAPASVSVAKSVTGVDATLAWSFDFSLAPTTGVTGVSPQTLSGTGNTTSATTASWTALTPGATYTITETTVAGWTPVITCTGVTDLDAVANTFTFVAQPGQALVCSATNAAAPASVSVAKSVTGVAATLAWSFDFSLAPTTGVTGLSPQTLSGTGNTTSALTASWTALTPGTTYTITETSVTGWTPVITCTGVTDLDAVANTFTFVAGVAQSLVCSATNAAAPASVSVAKSVTGVDATLAWSFDFSLAPVTGVTGLSPQTLSGTGNTTSATTASWTALTPGTTYTITETAITGWTAVITCTGVTDLDTVANTFTFVAGVGQSLACSATNAAAPASVSLSKSVTGVDATLAWSFDFSLAPTTGVTGLSPQTLSGTGNTTSALTASWTTLTPGTTYTITETAVTGWTPVITCTGVTDLDAVANTFTFVAGVGQSLVCSATNAAAPASVSVAKSVTGVDATLAWSFDFSLAPVTGVTGLSPQTLSGTGNTTSALTASWTALTPGTTYTITETAVAGWTPVITCTGVTDLDAVANTFTFVAGVAQSLVCSATNAAAPASVSVAKSVTGVAATLAWSFDFSLAPVTGVTGLSPQTLSGTGNTTSALTASWTALTPGTTYTITETSVTGWTAVITCTGVTDLDAVANTFTFVAGVGQSLVCSATNAAAPAQVSVSKSVSGVDATLAWSFDFSLAPTTGVTGLSPQTLSGTGNTTSALTASWATLTPGTTYTITETTVSSWTQTITCTGVTDLDAVANTFTFLAGVAQSLVCSATNAAAPAQVSVAKSVTGVDATLAWSFDFSLAPTTGVTGLSPQTLSGTGNTTSALTASWTALTPGTTYTITETAVTGWTPVITCTGVTDLDAVANTFTFVAGVGQSLVCSATNAAAPASVSVAKSVTSVDATLAWSFDFSLAPTTGVTGLSPQTLSGTGNTTSALTASWTALTPGTTYVMTEAAQTGWIATITCTGVTDLDAVANTFTFVAGVGQSLVCSITNSTIAHLTIHKSVTNDNGGTLQPSDFTLTLNGIDTPQGTSIDVPVGMPQTVAEHTVGGYAGVGAVCTSNFELSANSATPSITVTAQPGENIDCTITNDDMAPGLTIVKVVNNLFGGNLGVAAFPLLVDGAPVTSSVPTIPSANTNLAVTEVQQPGYTALSTVCASTDVTSANNLNASSGSATVKLAPGEKVTCTITNQDTPVDLALTKSDGGATATAGGAPFSYTLTVANVGQRNADAGEPVTVTDNLPSGFTWVTVPSNCSTAGQVLTCTIDPALLVAGGAPVTIVATVIAKADTPAGTYTNTALVTTVDDPGCATTDCVPVSCPVITPAAVGRAINNVACDTTPVVTLADMKIAKTASVADTSPGASFQWTLTVSNAGPSVASAVAISDLVPSVLSVTSASSATMQCSVAGNAVTCTKASFAVGETATVTVAVVVSPSAASQQVINTASVSSSTADPDPTNNSSTASVVVTGVLPTTGSSLIVPLIDWGAGLIGFGFLLLVFRRRRIAF
jgi:uncharacterized repeat protein (TIGR01451 family)